MSTEFDARIALLIKELVDGARSTEGRGFWKRLEDFTGVTARTWRSVYEQRQRATNEVLAALGKIRPQYSFWLMTGITDAANGHIAPITATTFPERAHVGDPYTDRYFQESIALKNKLVDDEAAQLTDTSNAIKFFERTQLFASWWEGPVGDAAYRLCSSPEYQELRQVWTKREEKRRDHIARIQQKKRAAKAGTVPVLGQDPRTAHQDKFFVFYEPKNDNKKD